MPAYILSTSSDPGTALWQPSAGSAFGDNLFGFDGGGGTIAAAESYSVWCKTGAVNPVNITVGNPAFAGQTYSFFFTTDGGQNVVVTFPASLNSAGNTVVTMNDANDSFIATAVVTDYGPAPVYRWIISTNNGCVLS